jgi:hypothetical protein
LVIEAVPVEECGWVHPIAIRRLFVDISLHSSDNRLHLNAAFPGFQEGLQGVLLANLVRVKYPKLTFEQRLVIRTRGAFRARFLFFFFGLWYLV